MESEFRALLDRMWLYSQGEDPGDGHRADRVALDAHAQAGDRNALYVLGWVQERDEPDSGQRAWLRAAQAGHARAMHALARQCWDAFDAAAYAREPGRGNLRVAALLDGAVPSGIGKPARLDTLEPLQLRARAIHWARLAALNGHTDAAADLGRWLPQCGDELRAAAVPWLEQSARAGQIEAAHTLATMYWSGDGVARDRKRAQRWYKPVRAHWEAQLAGGSGDLAYESVVLGRMLLQGQGGRRETVRALVLLRRAGEAGSGYALCELGNLYADGEHVARDFEQAEACFRRAIDVDPEPGYARFCLEQLPRKRQEAALQALQALPLERLVALAQHGDLALFGADTTEPDLAAILRHAGGTPFNLLSAAIVRLEAERQTGAALALLGAAARSNRMAAVNLARRLELGLNDTPQDLPASMHWLRHAARLGEPLAMWRLAERLLHADYGEPDPPQAYAWLLLAQQPRFASGIAGLGAFGMDEALRQMQQQLDARLQESQRDAGRALAVACTESADARWPDDA
jgi:TPR repeat protein